MYGVINLPINRSRYLVGVIYDYPVTNDAKKNGGLTAAVRALLEQRSLFTAEHVAALDAAIDAARELGKPRSDPIRVYPSVDARQNGSRNIHALAASPEVGPQQTKPLSKTDHSLTKPRSSGSSEEKSFGIFPMATPPNPPPRLSDSYKSLPPTPESESKGYTSPQDTKHTPDVCPDTPQANRQRVSAQMTPFRMDLATKKLPDAPKKPIWKSAKGNFWLEAVEFKLD